MTSDDTAPTAPRFLFLHGWENFRPEGHWQHIAVTELRSRGYLVEYPQLPDANTPTVAAWTDAVDAALTRLATPDSPSAGDPYGARVTAPAPIVVVAHSLGSALWLAVRPGTTPVSRALLVAAPAPEVLLSFPEVAEFGALLAERVAAVAGSRAGAGAGDAAGADSGVDPAASPAPWAADNVILVGSDNDRFSPAGQRAHFGDAFGLETVVIPGGGHLDVTAGYGAWPSIVEWCVDPGSSITARKP
ncbi:alpha/beta hydrolase [Glaciihabitans sp. dw_435]|uniref:RBBP9/YdeN family alpha/beta hydrolase n=1 Tax=Glaciihabitans sp. dw_435 TaxID=2720081 RepID=UPI001BD6B739|nr:alpha/beta hydrolase [Glaciihabitans sp. dw_435]